MIALTIGAALLVLDWVTGFHDRLLGALPDPTTLRQTTLGLIIFSMLVFALILNRRIGKG